MRISDWSSACALPICVLAPDDYTESQRLGAVLRAAGSDGLVYPSVRCPGGSCVGLFYPDLARRPVQRRHLDCHWNGSSVDLYRDARSEEHTSELPSLMRISYAVFCLKKKKTKTTNHNTNR